MSDIVERLRESTDFVRHEAADEIERLRAEFKRFMDTCCEGTRRGRPMDLIPAQDWMRARKALEGK